MSAYLPRLQVTVGVMDDATVAVEVAACEALVQWPYLSDMTLIWALASIFLLPPPISARGLDATPVMLLRNCDRCVIADLPCADDLHLADPLAVLPANLSEPFDITM